MTLLLGRENETRLKSGTQLGIKLVTLYGYQSEICQSKVACNYIAQLFISFFFFFTFSLFFS